MIPQSWERHPAIFPLKIFSLNQIPVAEEEVGIKSDKNRELPARSCENFASLHYGQKV
jgi:hypothetical protein